MTYRDRRLAKAERLREWADKRTASASAVFEAHEIYRGDTAFNTQPGHIPLRSRVIAQDQRAFESLQKAQSMSSRADNIEAAADHAIYSDDPDAIERLIERIADLEAERESIKAKNATYRKDHKAELAGMTPYQRNHAFPYPSYVLENLSLNLSRQRARLAQLKRKASR